MNKYQIEIQRAIQEVINQDRLRPIQVLMRKQEFINYLENSPKWIKTCRGYMTTDKKIVYTDNHRIGLNY